MTHLNDRYFTHATGETGKSYDGRRTFDAIKTTIAKRLVPECGLHHLKLCTTEEKEDIIEIREMTKEQREWPGHAPAAPAAPEPDSRPRQNFQNQ